jgi:hypothetical protein
MGDFQEAPGVPEVQGALGACGACCAPRSQSHAITHSYSDMTRARMFATASGTDHP